MLLAFLFLNQSYSLDSVPTQLEIFWLRIVEIIFVKSSLRICFRLRIQPFNSRACSFMWPLGRIRLMLPFFIATIELVAEIKLTEMAINKTIKPMINSSPTLVD